MAKIDKAIILIGILALTIIYFNGTEVIIGEEILEGNQQTVTQVVMSGTVTRVIDGDTAEVKLSNSTETIRFLGIDTPELSGNHDEGEYEEITNNTCLVKWAEKAKKYVNKQVNGTQVNLVYDSEAGNKGKYGRLLRYIELNGTDFNLNLVREGYARAYTESSFEREIHYMEAENQAKKETKGIWSCK